MPLDLAHKSNGVIYELFSLLMLSDTPPEGVFNPFAKDTLSNRKDLQDLKTCLFLLEGLCGLI